MLSLPWKSVHFTGIGGVGMTGLALILRDAGCVVTGTDEVPSKNLALLREAGCYVTVGHAAEQLPPELDLLVYSSAVQPTNPERAEAERRGLPQQRRGDFLATLAAYFPRVVSVAGSHGKTTVTAMLAYVLTAMGEEPGYLVGGDVADLPRPASAGAGRILVTEVDESDGTQAAMNSSHAIVTNVEDDHCWSVGGEDALYENFRQFGFRSGCLVTVASDRTRQLYAEHPQATFLAAEPPPLALSVPGEHNRSNAALVLEMVARLGLDRQAATAAIAGFHGVDRRLSVRYETKQVAVVEDYAHHPTEVRASIQAILELYPDRYLIVVIQPHRYERVLRYADDFARELSHSQIDIAIVTPPFAAWLDDRDLADPRRIVAGIRGPESMYADCSWPELADKIAPQLWLPGVVAVLGAGTITELPDLLIDRLKKRFS